MYIKKKMCGIIAVLNKGSLAPVAEILIQALERLEYRGYDSAGICLLDSESKFSRERSVGRIASLEKKIFEQNLQFTKAFSGIGHTRWATHGGVNVKNAHPHIAGCVSIVHNGIIENYQKLKGMLNVPLKSETDSEVIAVFLNQFIEEGFSFVEAFKKTIGLLQGTYAIVALSSTEPGMMIGAKKGSPMAIGYNDDQIFIGSDAIALSSLSNKLIHLEEGDIVICHDSTFEIFDQDNTPTKRPEVLNTIAKEDTTKGCFEDFMLKEIHEEPLVFLDSFNNFSSPIDIKKYKSLYLIACGTSYYAGLLAKYWIEDLARVQVNVEIASEFRYRNPVLPKESLYIFISQSGETIDTLCALRQVKELRLDSLSLVNVAGSSIARESKYLIQTQAGVEMGVASTKAFISQALTLLLLVIDKSQIHIDQIVNPMKAILDQKEVFKKQAQKLKDSKAIMYIGRGTSYPIALEGSLKMKEITYINSEGYPAGEIKHGPIALIDENVFTVILAPKDTSYEKTLSNAQEIIARKGKIVLIGEGKIEGQDNIAIKEQSLLGGPFVLATAIHLLAYYTAKAKGLDVDKPRNLAKSVTVE